MINNIQKTIDHLKNQIDTAKKLDSKFVYITLEEAEHCLELAEAQDVINDILAENEMLKEERFWEEDYRREQDLMNRPQEMGCR